MALCFTTTKLASRPGGTARTNVNLSISRIGASASRHAVTKQGPSLPRGRVVRFAQEAQTLTSARASQVPSDEQARVQKLMRENARLRKLIERNAEKLTPKLLHSFAQRYTGIAASAQELGLQVSDSLLQLAASAKVPVAEAQSTTSAPQATAVQPSLAVSKQEQNVPSMATSSACEDDEFAALDTPSYDPVPESSVAGALGSARAAAKHNPPGAEPPPPVPAAATDGQAPAAMSATSPAPPTKPSLNSVPQAVAVQLKQAQQPLAAAPLPPAEPSSQPQQSKKIEYADRAGKPVRVRVAQKAGIITFSFESSDKASSSSSSSTPNADDALRASRGGRGRKAVQASRIISGREGEDAIILGSSDGAGAAGAHGGSAGNPHQGHPPMNGSATSASKQPEASGDPSSPPLPPVAASRDDGEAAAARRAARQLVASHDPSQAVYDKHHWLLVTVPDKPVAGEDFVIYFNKNQSEALRSKNRVQMTYGFNKWELNVSDEEHRPDLQPVSSISREFGADFWSCKIRIPKNAYELNFVLGDCAGVYENNLGKDFTLLVEHGITWDEWVDTAADRAAAEQAKRRAEERIREDEAERQRLTAALQGDRDRGWAQANELRDRYASLQTDATLVFDRDGKPLWRAGPQPESVVAGGRLTLRYNLAASATLAWLANKPDAGSMHLIANSGLDRFGIPPTCFANQTLEIKYGFSGWRTPASAMFKKAQGGQPSTNEQWWEVELALPYDAASVEFVVHGPGDAYDNNGGADYHIGVAPPTIATESPPALRGAGSVASASLAGLGGQAVFKANFDAWISSLAEVYRQQAFEERVAAEALAKATEAKRAEKRQKAHEMVQAVERRKVRHVLFTEPEVIQAGQPVTIFYNPDAGTCLAGRPDVFVSGSWNRWNHARSWGPMRMTRPQSGHHFQATIKVPGDAFKMDFVFSDSPTAGKGTYDNRGGFDYHLPVSGSPVREPSLYIAHITVELAPIAKVGGLGDVVTALGRAVKEQGHQVEVILPRYDFFSHSPVLQGQLTHEAEFDWGGTKIQVTTAVVEGLRCFFIEPRNGFFNTGTVYGRYDDEVRFDFFCRASLEFLLQTKRQPDILHCHDWSTAHVAKAYWADYHPYGLWKPVVVFTIHNLDFGAKKIAEAAHHCQKFTTVSPTYAHEIGGAAPVSPHLHKFCGIRNGIDPELWDPEASRFLPRPYSSADVVDGKRAARQALRQRLGLTDWGDKLIVGVISRLTHQKGTALIKHAQWRTQERGGQFVLLGSAPDPRIQAEYNQLAATVAGENCSFNFKYDEPLSYLIYAAADLIVVPSMFEPCGLTQLIAMRYGSIPVVRHTGGLKDTVFDVDFDKERAAWELYGSSDWKRDGIDATNGFAFTGTDTGSLDYALNRAIDAWYNDRAWFHSVQSRVMEQDWSWNRPAIDYIELYYSAIKSAV